MQSNAVFIFKIKKCYLCGHFVTKIGLLVTKTLILVTKIDSIGTNFSKTGIKRQIYYRTIIRVL